MRNPQPSFNMRPEHNFNSPGSFGLHRSPFAATHPYRGAPAYGAPGYLQTRSELEVIRNTLDSLRVQMGQVQDRLVMYDVTELERQQLVEQRTRLLENFDGVVIVQMGLVKSLSPVPPGYSAYPHAGASPNPAWSSGNQYIEPHEQITADEIVTNMTTLIGRVNELSQVVERFITKAPLSAKKPDGVKKGVDATSPVTTDKP